MNRIPVIGFKGKGGTGKSAAARYVVGKGYVRTSFAAPLRAMLKTIGMTDAELAGDKKELPSATLSGQSPRVAMQLLGTEWGRTLDPNFWVNLWLSTAHSILDQDGHCIVVDDCRFPNEAAAIRALGGFVIEIQSGDGVEDGAVGIAGHVSESQDFDPDIIVVNTKSSWEAFHSGIDEAIDVLLRDAAEDARE